ncbi:hypothetical protein PoB_007696400 [Plakobranchus ocellatus]|uniref:Uncharacterized protein n=1 Tax=Plakobranchus ocellatus TaxID=259542 RepID=A0AAV4E2I5_9GAST|nr:hypothetical protein PoB_007696400 [Plakobranchus ocellatus]
MAQECRCRGQDGRNCMGRRTSQRRVCRRTFVTALCSERNEKVKGQRVNAYEKGLIQFQRQALRDNIRTVVEALSQNQDDYHWMVWETRIMKANKTTLILNHKNNCVK